MHSKILGVEVCTPPKETTTESGCRVPKLCGLSMMRTHTPSCKTGTSLDVFVRARLVKGRGVQWAAKFHLFIHQAMPRETHTDYDECIG
eukprot:scaffold8675_cov75-Skeletonema_marinoi.AAC.2